MESIDNILNRRFKALKPGDVRLADLAAEAAEAGFKPFELNAKLFPICSPQAIQEAWSDWTHISEREEIRLRLMALNTFEKIHPSLIPFLIFYFRSSDSLLYQTAGQIIGKNLLFHKGLSHFFREYLAQRNVDASQPVDLNGIRSKRRILVALASLYAAKHAGKHIDTVGEVPDGFFAVMPLDLDKLELHPPENHLDLSAVMLALSILLKHGLADGCLDAAEKLLQLPGSQDVAIWDRNVIRNWGVLLNATPLHDSRKCDLCRSFLQSGIHHLNQSAHFKDRLHILYELDEIVKSMVHIPKSEKVIRELDVTDPEDARALDFLKLQFRYWRLRETNSDAPFDDVRQTGSEVLDIVAETGRLRNGDSRPDAIYKLFQPLYSEHAWRLQPTEERVLRTFFILHNASQMHLSRKDEINQMISVIRPSLSEVTYARRTNADADQPLLDNLLVRLTELELTAKGQIPDGRLIQKITDENLLISLLPTETDSELLPVLADAFEHRLRLLLAFDPQFDVDHYVYKITIREPNRNFYRYMREITHKRHYGREGDPAVDLSARFQLLYQQGAGGKAGGASILANDLPFWGTLDQIRARLTSLLSSERLFDLLEAFIHELEGTGAETLSSTSTLHDLINITQQDGARWIRSGFPSLWNQSAPVINQRLAQIHQQLRSDLPKLKPDQLSGYMDAAEASHRIKESLEEAASLLSPTLGKNEAAIVNRISSHLKQLTDHWIFSLSDIGKHWDDFKQSGTSIRDEQRNAIFQSIGKEANSHMKSALLNVFLATLLKPDANRKQLTWIHQYHILLWAAQAMTSPVLNDSETAEWKKSLVALWKQMLNTAMEQSMEARVVQLIKARQFSELRREEEIQMMLPAVKTWCFDRYDMNHAYICNRELAPDKNLVQNRWTTAREFLAHFSYVWLALVVGVILMFDFGDPWAELAEIGDVGGVLFAFVLGVTGAYLYVFADLNKKAKLIKGDPFEWASRFVRVAVFILITLFFTVLMVLLFYYMFSSTDQVVTGANAVWHIMSWTGFALFIGVFFGLLGKKRF